MVHTPHSMIRTGLLALSSAALLVGCSGVPVADVRASLSKAKPCCASVASVVYAPLALGSRTKFDIGTSSPVLETSEGLAYFAAFQLPSGAGTLEIQAQNTSYLPKSTYPDPLVLVLDSQHRKLAELKDIPLSRGRHTIVPGLYEYHYAAALRLPPEAHYVLIFARPQSDRSQSAVSDNGMYWPVPSAPVGTLALVAR
ncbi:MalM family protein [Piscinibacter sakaiensis]|uniref:MalM family protein n=1 Tax=Piscinibacter sakaiensis TaxID=1547922 RepID=UPI0018D0750A|nr:MalM family protein [Piscinibacter sakaiensis]